MRLSELFEDINDMIAGYQMPDGTEGDLDYFATISFENGEYIAYLDTGTFSKPTVEEMVAELKKYGYTYHAWGKDLYAEAGVPNEIH